VRCALAVDPGLCAKRTIVAAVLVEDEGVRAVDDPASVLALYAVAEVHVLARDHVLGPAADSEGSLAAHGKILGRYEGEDLAVDGGLWIRAAARGPVALRRCLGSVRERAPSGHHHLRIGEGRHQLPQPVTGGQRVRVQVRHYVALGGAQAAVPRR